MRTWKPALAKSDWPKKKKKTQNKKQTKKTTKGKKKEIKKDWKITKPSQPFSFFTSTESFGKCFDKIVFNEKIYVFGF